MARCRDCPLYTSANDTECYGWHSYQVCEEKLIYNLRKAQTETSNAVIEAQQWQDMYYALKEKQDEAERESALK